MCGVCGGNEMTRKVVGGVYRSIFNCKVYILIEDDLSDSPMFYSTINGMRIYKNIHTLEFIGVFVI